MIWKHVLGTIAILVFLAGFFGVCLGLNWVVENYEDTYEWMTIGSGFCVFAGFMIEAFMVITGWHVALFTILSFPMLHRLAKKTV